MLNPIRNIVLFAFSLFCALPAISFGQAKPIESGDGFTWTTYTAKQAGNNPPEFLLKNVYNFKAQIEGNGDRKFVSPKGYVYFADTKSFTSIMWDNKQIVPSHQFVRFPPDGKLEPGMTWAVPRRMTRLDCGAEEALDYQATSEKGPVVNITIDGKDKEIATIRIYYEAWVAHCDRGFKWKKTEEVLYAPELNELVRSRNLAYFKESTSFIDNGGGWAITAIKTTGK